MPEHTFGEIHALKLTIISKVLTGLDSGNSSPPFFRKNFRIFGFRPALPHQSLMYFIVGACVIAEIAIDNSVMADRPWLVLI